MTQPSPLEGGTVEDEVASVAETRSAYATLKGLGGAYEDAVVESFVSRLGDRIDDRVADAFDEQFAERLAAPGPAARALARDRRAALALSLASLMLGTMATALVGPGHTDTLLVLWIGIALVNVIHFLRRG